MSYLRNRFNEVISVTGAKGCGRDFSGHCPAHKDKTPSLSIRLADEKILLTCHAGCSYEEICKQLERMGISLKWPVHSEGISTNGAALRIWDSSYPLGDTPNNNAIQYLALRSISLDIFPDSLRFNPDLPYYENGSKSTYPGLIAKITDTEGRIMGIQRIYL